MMSQPTTGLSENKPDMVEQRVRNIISGGNTCENAAKNFLQRMMYNKLFKDNHTL